MVGPYQFIGINNLIELNLRVCLLLSIRTCECVCARVYELSVLLNHSTIHSATFTSNGISIRMFRFRLNSRQQQQRTSEKTSADTVLNDFYLASSLPIPFGIDSVRIALHHFRWKLCGKWAFQQYTFGKTTFGVQSFPISNSCGFSIEHRRARIKHAAGKEPQRKCLPRTPHSIEMNKTRS